MTALQPAEHTSSRPVPAPLAVVMISYNEAHNIEAVLLNLKGFAQEVFLVDSYSTDDTVDIAIGHGVHVVQRRFRGFGDQWNYALHELPITAPWTMKLDPDERLTDDLKESIGRITRQNEVDGFQVARRLWFMGQRLPVVQTLLRGWRTGKCRFSDVAVNEHALVEGNIVVVDGEMEHHDSPTLHHWFDKQNHYTTSEALSFFDKSTLSANPRLFGAELERRMWLKKNFRRIPGRYTLLYFYNLIATGAWRAGRTGFAWARLRVEVHRMIELKLDEMRISGVGYAPPSRTAGASNKRAHQADR